MANVHILRISAVLLLAAAGQGCAGTMPARTVDADSDNSGPVVSAAQAVVGAPYRYGGFTPAGFDCSGLVYYAYHQAGIPVPRTAGAQLRLAHPVALDELRAGDVLFFELEGKKAAHVGIYAGRGSFIHAPSSGRNVSYASLGSLFWSSRLKAAGRFD